MGVTAKKRGQTRARRARTAGRQATIMPVLISMEDQAMEREPDPEGLEGVFVRSDEDLQVKSTTSVPASMVL